MCNHEQTSLLTQGITSSKNLPSVSSNLIHQEGEDSSLGTQRNQNAVRHPQKGKIWGPNRGCDFAKDRDTEGMGGFRSGLLTLSRCGVSYPLCRSAINLVPVRDLGQGLQPAGSLYKTPRRIQLCLSHHLSSVGWRQA